MAVWLTPQQLRIFAMVSKTPNNSGYSLISVLVAFAIFLFLIGAVSLVVSPSEIRQRARDEKRLSDMATLENIINEYKIDNGRYPDDANMLRESTALPSGNIGPLFSVTDGWIDENFSAYVNRLPIDPDNNASYHYYYQHNGYTYELNARLEYYADYAENDGGNNPLLYELGDDLTIL